MVGVIGVNSRIFNALTERGVSVFLVSQAASENNTTIAVRNCDAGFGRAHTQRGVLRRAGAGHV